MFKLAMCLHTRQDKWGKYGKCRSRRVSEVRWRASEDARRALENVDDGRCSGVLISSFLDILEVGAGFEGVQDWAAGGGGRGGGGVG